MHKSEFEVDINNLKKNQKRSKFKQYSMATKLWSVYFLKKSIFLWQKKQLGKETIYIEL